MMVNYWYYIGLIGILGTLVHATQAVHGQGLIYQDSIYRQNAATSYHQLKNGTQVLYRYDAHSGLNTLILNYDFGIAHLPYEQKALGQILFRMMPLSAGGFSDEGILSMNKTYSGGVVCQAGLEISQCALGVAQDDWDKGFSLFVTTTLNANFTNDEHGLQTTSENLKQILARRSHELTQQQSSPQHAALELASRAFYPNHHPYQLTSFDELAQLKRINKAQLQTIYENLRSSAGQKITYVGSLPHEKILNDLETAFGKQPIQKQEQPVLSDPPYDPSHTILFEPREDPLSYISLKWNAPARTSKDFLAAQMMTVILNEAFASSVNLERSQFSAQAYLLDHKVSAGVILILTNDPQKAFAALDQVILQFKQTPFESDKLDAIKAHYLTNYYLSIEEQTRFAATLTEAFFYDDSAEDFYALPRRIAELDPADIQDAARKYLVNFRMGILASQASYDPRKAEAFVQRHHKL